MKEHASHTSTQSHVQVEQSRTTYARCSLLAWQHRNAVHAVSPFSYPKYIRLRKASRNDVEVASAHRILRPT